FTRPDGLFPQTISHPVRLYAEHVLAVGLDVHVAGDTRDLSPTAEASGAGWTHHVADLGPFSLLDAAGTCDEDGRRVCLTVVNRHAAEDIEATIDLGPVAIPGPVSLAQGNGPA